MAEYLESLSIIVSPHFSKKAKLQNNSLVTIKSGNSWYPAQISINKKLKVDKILYDNGCIPDSLDQETFLIETGCSWLFARAMTLSCQQVCEKSSFLYPQMKKFERNRTSTIPFSLSDLSSLSNFCNFLKQELIQRSNLCLRTGMKICFTYLTQLFLLTVEEIHPSFYETSTDTIQSQAAFRCFKDTRIDIIENKTCCQTVPDGLNFEDFGGYETQLETLKTYICKFFEGTKKGINGILISGMSGVGKSFIGAILQSFYGDKCRILSSEDIISSYKSEAEVTLKLEFQKAHERAPSVIFIDNLDEICSSRDQDAHTAGIVNALLYLIDGVHSGQSKEVLVIATARHPETLDQALRRPGRLSHDIIFPVPSEQDRLSILHCLLRGAPPPPVISRDVLSAIASKTSGFVAADLLNLITESFAQTDDEGTAPSINHFEVALDLVKPSSLKNVVVTPSKKVDLREIIGYQTLRSALLTTFELSLHRRELLLAGGITSPSRILIFGPSGCGKSMTVYGLANHFNLAIIPVRRSNVFGKYFGESEKNLNALFQQAQKSSPCILHFENFDGIAGRRQKNAEVSSDVEDRVINHLKVMLDGVVGYENIFVVAETNRPDLLDKDVIRHGRFHKYFHFDLPTPEDRRTVFERERRSKGIELFHQISMFQTPILDSLVAKSEGYSVAEIVLLCKEIKSCLEEEEPSMGELTPKTRLRWNSAVEEAFESVSQRTSSKMMKHYHQFSSFYCQKL